MLAKAILIGLAVFLVVALIVPRNIYTPQWFILGTATLAGLLIGSAVYLGAFAT